MDRWFGGRLEDIRAFIDGVYGHELHAKRVDSLAGATLGVMTSASLAVAVIGQTLVQPRGLVTKYAIKQADRLLSNQNIPVGGSFARWSLHLIGARKEIVVVMDWTDFDRDGQLHVARVTASHPFGVAVDCVHAKAMKQPWSLAVSNAGGSDRHSGASVNQPGATACSSSTHSQGAVHLARGRW